jgi:hypothetical protein
MPRKPPVFEQVKSRLDELIDEWGAQITGKQRITAYQLHRQLQLEGLQAGITLVSAHLRKVRRQAAKVLIPLVHRPGHEALVDFFEVTPERRASEGRRDAAPVDPGGRAPVVESGQGRRL